MTPNMHNLLELPDETLLEILEYLRLDDVKNVRLACKRLYLLTLDKNITKKECLLLNERVFKRNGSSVVAALLKSQRIFEVIIFQNDNYYFEARLPEELLASVIRKFGDHVKEVFYYKTNMEFSRTFKVVINKCPNLELICIKDCNDLFMQESFRFYETRLLKMKSLKIYETQYLSDLILYRLFTLCPNLDAVTLSSCGMNMHNGVYGKFYREEPSDTLVPSNDVFNYKYLFHLLNGLGSIKDLNLSFSNLSHKNVIQILQMPSMKLRKLNLLGCREISWPKLLTSDVFANHQSITNLNLSHSVLVNDSVLLYICNSLPNLEKLHLASCFALTDNGFAQMSNLKQLKELSINNNHELTGEVLSHLTNSKMNSLKALHTNFDSEQITNYLTKLKLIRCEIGFILKATRFTDDAIKQINKTQHFIKELHIHSLTITNTAFIGETCENLNSDLETLFMNSLTTNLENYNLHENIDIFRQIFHYKNIQSDYSISNLRHLDILNLDCCQKVTDELFKYSMDLPFLRKLSLSSTKVSFVGVCYLVQKCPNLEYLDLENTLINDASVCVLAQALPKLSNLSLKNCSKLTSLSYKFIAKYCRKLKALHGWNALSHDELCDIDSTLKTIFNLPNMCKLYATRCMLIEDENIKLLPYANHPFYEHILYD